MVGEGGGAPWKELLFDSTTFATREGFGGCETYLVRGILEGFCPYFFFLLWWMHFSAVIISIYVL